MPTLRLICLRWAHVAFASRILRICGSKRLSRCLRKIVLELANQRRRVNRIIRGEMGVGSSRPCDLTPHERYMPDHNAELGTLRS
jgi:hypothetical protein